MLSQNCLSLCFACQKIFQYVTCFSSLNINAPHAEQMLSILPTSWTLTIVSLKTSKFCLAMGNLIMLSYFLVSLPCIIVFVLLSCLCLYHFLLFAISQIWDTLAVKQRGQVNVQLFSEN